MTQVLFIGLAAADRDLDAIGPTICAALGVPLPDAEGKPLRLPHPNAKAVAARAMA